MNHRQFLEKVNRLESILDKEALEKAILAMLEPGTLASRSGCILAIATYLKGTRVCDLLEKIEKLELKIDRMEKAVMEFASDDVCSIIGQIVNETPEPTEY